MTLFPDPQDPQFAPLAAVAAVVNDVRNIQPPCFLLTATQAAWDGECAVVRTIEIRAIAPGPDHADAHRWMWEHAAPALLAVDLVAAVEAEPYERYPTLLASIEEAVPWP